jgi:DNA-binding transcriptional ArsR family regulator
MTAMKYTTVAEQHFELLKDKAEALVFYLKLSMLVTREVCDPDSPGKKIGLVLGGAQLTYGNLVERTGYTQHTVERHVSLLLQRRLVLRKRGPYSAQYALCESTKYPHRKAAEGCPRWIIEARNHKSGTNKPDGSEVDQRDRDAVDGDSGVDQRDAADSVIDTPSVATHDDTCGVSLVDEWRVSSGVTPIESTASGPDNKDDNRVESREREQRRKTAPPAQTPTPLAKEDRQTAGLASAVQNLLDKLIDIAGTDIVFSNNQGAILNQMVDEFGLEDFLNGFRDFYSKQDEFLLKTAAKRWLETGRQYIRAIQRAREQQKAREEMAVRLGEQGRAEVEAKLAEIKAAEAEEPQEDPNEF